MDFLVLLGYKRRKGVMFNLNQFLLIFLSSDINSLLSWQLIGESVMQQVCPLYFICLYISY